MTSDVGAHCAQCHAKEAELIKAMKLEHLWEPTPFPVELPPDQRDDRTADPSFAVTPWPARPPSLWQDPPQQPGEIRYAQRRYWQGDDLLLLVALTAAEAEERHRTNQVYVLAARLPDNILMSVNHSLSIDFMYPDPERSLPDRYYYIFLQSPSHQVTASARFELGCRHSAEIKSIHVGKRGSARFLWSLNVYRDEEVEVSVRDDRGDELVVSRSSITHADRERRTLRGLAFGSHLVFAERVRLLLQIAGFGELS